MEHYESTCSACGAKYDWLGYKTGIGKSPEQLAAMKREATVCRECNEPGLKTLLYCGCDEHEQASLVATTLKVLAHGPIAPGKTGRCVTCGREVRNPTSVWIQPFCSEHAV